MSMCRRILCLFVWIATLSIIFFSFIIYKIQSVYIKAETKTEAKTETKIEIKTETKIETKIETDIYGTIDDYLQSCVKNANIPAMSVTIVSKEEVLFSQSYGACESEDTPFLLGSVSKSFTAVCMMKLVEQKKVDLSANLSAYLPNATDGDRITVSQLLNHTSGLGEYQTLENYKIVNKQGIHNYANVNYSLLGEIIETVSGNSYNDYITENLFQPLLLSHTAATHNESLENGLIDGYTNYWGFPVKTSHKYPTSKNAWITVPAGYISSSANDLGKYLQMYLNGGNGILSKQSIDTMFYGDTVYVEDNVPYWYGYGWTMVKEPLSEPVLRHSGLVETGTSCVFILPESELAIAVTANINDYFVTNNMMDSLGWGIVLMLLGNPPNEIGSYAYRWNHLWMDLIMLFLLTIAIFPLYLFPKYVNSIKYRKIVLKERSLLLFLLFLLFHLLLPIFLLSFIPLFFATPLWVAQAFVPDVFITVMISAILLFVSGFVKSIVLYQHKS